MQNDNASQTVAPAPTRIGFRDLIDPTSPEAFFEQCFGIQAQHFSGADTRFDRMFSWRCVNDLLNMSSLWSAATLKLAINGRDLAPEEYCVAQQNRDGGAIAEPDPAQVQALIRQGAAISLNLVESMMPEIAAIAAGLQCWFDGEAVCSVDGTRSASQRTQSRFHPHDVFVLQIDGTRTWNIYTGTFDEAVDLDGYRSSSFSDEHQAAARGTIDSEITMTPGDTLYIPRGRYHDIQASDKASLHLSFGIDFPRGFHFLNGIADALLQDPFFRQPLPRFDRPDAHRAHMRKLAEHVRDYTLTPDLARSIRAHQRQRAFAYCFPAYNLPAAEPGAVLRVRSLNSRLLRRDGDWRLEQPGAETVLSPAEAKLADWLMPQDFILADEAETAFGSEFPVAAILERFQSIGLLEAI